MQVNEKLRFKHILQFYSTNLTKLYRGFVPPLVAQSVYKSVIFFTNNFCNECLFSRSITNTSLLISGFVAGTVNSLIVAPVELLRSRQILSQNEISVIQSMKSLLDRGAITLFWKSFPLTALRDGPGVSLYLFTFDLVKRNLIRNNEVNIKTKGNISLSDRILAGACAGVVFWVWALPIDTLKSIIESSTLRDINSKSESNITLVRNVLNKTGILHLYRAWPVALGRGIPGAAVTLTVYDVVFDWLSK